MGNIMQGINLMVAGMGMVFAFLLIMVFIVNLSAKLLAPYTHLLEEAPKAAPKKPAAKKELSESELRSVITAAVSAFRNDKNK